MAAARGIWALARRPQQEQRSAGRPAGKGSETDLGEQPPRPPGTQGSGCPSESQPAAERAPMVSARDG